MPNQSFIFDDVFFIERTKNNRGVICHALGEGGILKRFPFPGASMSEIAEQLPSTHIGRDAAFFINFNNFHSIVPAAIIKDEVEVTFRAAKGETLQNEGNIILRHLAAKPAEFSAASVVVFRPVTVEKRYEQERMAVITPVEASKLEALKKIQDSTPPVPRLDFLDKGPGFN